MYKKIRLLLALLFVHGINGCEYDLSKENFIDIQKPSGTHKFDLSLLKEEDTIKVFNQTEFTYNINTYGLKIHKAGFELNNKTWSVFSEKGSFSIAPNDYPAGFDTLSLTIITNSGTGSVSDVVGAEGYIVEKKWLLLIDGRPSEKITATNSITEVGFMKISWPKCEQYNFQAYELQGAVNGRGISKIITDVDSTYYVDS